MYEKVEMRAKVATIGMRERLKIVALERRRPVHLLGSRPAQGKLHATITTLINACAYRGVLFL